ncbi:competence/damage-inducible protein CinA domain [Propionibacterium sp. oral taxon 192 str. F0372]|uniref:CinA family protein n=1 Tax=Propionibacterium sp. oral taxon 192 TaxID=671222 RepID=UPI000353BD46|nr:CinA family protein [Propionibacterium sp. oral taxon 192]EPH02926.1 competence/damage-inducible protein CinA domain [Propionibacterium sp. oral taxon 192 str. F0372]
MSETTHLLAAQVIWELRAARLSVSTCESLTGGGLGAILTSIPGASAIFRGGLITYASDLKVSLAGVDAHTVVTKGVINEPTARQMAVGAAWTCRSDIGLATTGVAGPDSQDGEEPGTVWVGLALPARWSDRVRAREFRFAGDRAEIREQTIHGALSWLLVCLKENFS